MHISATAFGGGVSEILYTLVPLMRDVGLDCEWQVIYGREEFFNATKLMHNALQGAPQDLDEEQWATWRQLQRDERARALRRLGRVPGPRPAAGGAVQAGAGEGQGLGVALPHRPVDPQPAHDRPAAALHRGLSRVAVPHARLRARGDERQCQRRAAGDRPADAEEHGAVARGRGFRVRAVRDRRRPAADLPGLALRSLEGPAGRDRRLPPVKESMPEVQLALVGSMASDDPEGWDFFNATIAHADGDPDMHILNNFNNVGAIEVNAFQSHSDVLIQKSTREGFGLTVSEAIWKARPFIGGDVGGIPLQIEDGVTGTWSRAPSSAPSARSRSSQDPELGQARWAGAARSTCARTSSRRATCATT